MEMRYEKTCPVFWPFIALFEGIARLVVALVGLALMIAGGALCITVICAFVGIPLAIFGYKMMKLGFS